MAVQAAKRARQSSTSRRVSPSSSVQLSHEEETDLRLVSAREWEVEFDGRPETDQEWLEHCNRAATDGLPLDAFEWPVFREANGGRHFTLKGSGAWTVEVATSRSFALLTAAKPLSTLAYETPSTDGRSHIDYHTSDPLPQPRLNCLLAGNTFLVGKVPAALGLSATDFPKKTVLTVSFLNEKLCDADYPARSLVYVDGVRHVMSLWPPWLPTGWPTTPGLM